MFVPNYVAVLSYWDISLKTTNVGEKQSHRYPLYLQPSTYSPNSTDFKMLGSAQRFTGNELFMMTPFTPITSVTESVHYGQWVFIKSIKKTRQSATLCTPITRIFFKTDFSSCNIVCTTNRKPNDLEITPAAQPCSLFD